MKHIIRLAAMIFTVTVLHAQNTLITEKSFIVVRNGKEVTATYGGKTLSGDSWKDRTNPLGCTCRVLCQLF